MKTFKTPKGTELPLMDIKGKDYLQAAPRIFWLKEEHPDWSIETEFLQLSDKSAVCKATIRDGQGRVLSQATSMETLAGFESFVEKSETCAVSRAASFCGYGTLMAQELEEQGKLAESPVGKKPVEIGSGSYVITFGKKFNGKRLDECDIYELNNFHDWLKQQQEEKGLDGVAHQAYVHIKEFLKTRSK